MLSCCARKRRLHANKAGMTLIELVFAVGILAFSLGILFSSVITLFSMGEVSEGRTRAAMIMTSVLEDSRSMDFPTLLAWDPNPIEFEDANAVVVLEALDINGNLVELPANIGEETFPNPTEVRATVMWVQRGGRVYNVSASTFVGR